MSGAFKFPDEVDEPKGGDQDVEVTIQSDADDFEIEVVDLVSDLGLEIQLHMHIV